MDAALPVELRAALDGLLIGKSRNALAQRARALSDTYRQGGASQAVILQPDDALAYAVSRMPATYAAMVQACAALAQRCPGFAPTSLFDCGAGTGSASWAAHTQWSGLSAVTQLDHNPVFLDLSRGLAMEAPALAAAVQVRGRVADWRPDRSFDLVLLGYALTELPDDDRARSVEKLWQACDGALIIVEPGTPAGTRRMLQARRWLIEAGALIAAPCPHHAACPLAPPDWCHFAARLPRSRDHMLMKDAEVPYEDEKFSYLVAVRPALRPEPFAARVLAPPQHGKGGATLKLCMADGAARLTVFPKRDKSGYARVRKKRWGDALD